MLLPEPLSPTTPSVWPRPNRDRDVLDGDQGVPAFPDPTRQLERLRQQTRLDERRFGDAHRRPSRLARFALSSTESANASGGPESRIVVAGPLPSTGLSPVTTTAIVTRSSW